MKRRDEVVVGIFIAATLVVAIVGTLWLARRGFGGATAPVYTRFSWGDNLKQGQQVLFAGVEVGSVEKVEIGRGFLDVTLRIQRDQLAKMPEGSMAIVQNVSFFGDKAVAILPGPEANASLQPGDTIPAGKAPPSVDQLLIRVDSVERMLGDVAETVHFQLVQQGGIKDVHTTIRETRDLMAQLNGIVQEEARTVASTLQGLRRTANAVDSAQVDSLVHSLQDASANLQRLSSGMLDASNHLTAILAKVDSGGGTAAMLVNDAGLYNDIRSLVARLDSLTEDLKQNPRKYIPPIKVF
ncbi:MAG TPA: MlaD family protein [Gemmatimonadaceae bacterium]|nr:MlaD family protein [Gemmatimonadaceae bacterium]